jgi:hypothetical protein
MYLRTVDEAMDALAEILELPERRRQIVESTVRIALCVTPEARRLMYDVQAAVLSGGLDALRRSRQEAVAKLTETTVRRKAPGVDLRKDPLLESVGQALDLLRMVDLLVRTFPALVPKHPRWELARFVHANASYVRDAVEAGMRKRGKPEHAPLEAKVLARVEEQKPWWPEWADSIRQACVHYGRLLAKEAEAHPGAGDPDTLFHVVTMEEERAREVLRRMAGTSDELLAYFRELRTRIDLVLTAQDRAAGA